ncbi:hypothetical protein FD723_40675 (plasmid) [Nostoc sp. C052]|uniref:hypothetical protein n=1 Tax=Nostoc sp. C052 TaxID=2576902 RepID=UPI0015C36A16|nr:hypothetical protein [Nostoc sp. C052]QLE46530.1 hypothetical protein FD723_40675 [Nostoc sp. C052]
MSRLINQAQKNRLWAIAHSQGLKKCEVQAVFSEFGITSTTSVTTDQYDAIISRIQEYAIVEF